MLTAAEPPSSPEKDAAEPPAPRRQEILASIRHVFAEKGFERASMQDLARAAGMSVGNFYRYFPSKAAMIEALIQRQMEETRTIYARITASDDPLSTLRETLRSRIQTSACGAPEEVLIWAEISVAALRNPDYAEVVARLNRHITDTLIEAIALSADLSVEAARRRYGGQAQMALLLIRCNLLAPLEDLGTDGGAPDGSATLPGVKALLLRQIDLLIDEIAAARPPRGRADPPSTAPPALPPAPSPAARSPTAAVAAPLSDCPPNRFKPPFTARPEDHRS